MKKLFFTSLFIAGLLIAPLSSISKPINKADAASGTYYSSITASSGTALLGQLHDLMVTTHKTYTTYTDCKTSSIVYSIEPGSSSDYVTDFYTQRDNPYVWNGGLSGHWNREHVWCQSHSIDHSGVNGQLWGEKGGGSDLHHLRPTEHDLNSTRNNHPYGLISDFTTADRNKNIVVSKYDNAPGGYYVKGYDVFEPLDTVKGDVARILFYVYMHYSSYKYIGGTIDSDNKTFYGELDLTDIVTTPANTEKAAFDLLLSWNASDPVSEEEIYRNEGVYAIQGNRNPFIDNSDYANAIWGDSDYIVVDSKQTLSTGETYQLRPVASDSNVKTFSYSTNNPSVATVSSAGLIRAVGQGNAVITVSATINSKPITATCSVTVTRGALEPITSIFKDYNFDDEEHMWTVKNRGYALSSGKGVWISESYPNAGATSKESFTDISKITVTYCTNSSSGEGSFSLKVGDNAKAYKPITYVTGGETLRELVFNYDIPQSGVIDFVANCSSNSIYIYSIKIEFAAAYNHIQSISFEDDSVNLAIGETYQSEITFNPDNATCKDVTYESTSESVVTVTDTGLITAISAGSASVIATSIDGNKTATLEVTVDSPVAPILGSKIACYELVESNLTDWSGEYLLVCGSLTWTGVDVAECNIGVTIKNKKIVTKPETASSLIVEKMSGGYSIKLSGGTNDGKYIGGENGANKIVFNSTAILNTISYNNESAQIVSNTSVMRYNSNKSNNRFRYFKAATYTDQNPVQLYKAVYFNDLITSWIDENMHMSSNVVGQCNSYYPIAKAALRSIENQYAGTIDEFRNNTDYALALSRYEAWANALNDLAPYVGSTISNAKVNAIVDDDSLFIILMISIASLAPICLFMLTNKKRKHLNK